MGMFNALNLGDIMNEMIHRIRPYEVEKGKTDEVFQSSVDTLCTLLRERKPFEDQPKICQNGWRKRSAPTKARSGSSG